MAFDISFLIHAGVFIACVFISMVFLGVKAKFFDFILLALLFVGLKFLISNYFLQLGYFSLGLYIVVLLWFLFQRTSLDQIWEGLFVFILMILLLAGASFYLGGAGVFFGFSY